MTIINATKKVWGRLGAPSRSVLVDDDTTLGSWCAHIFYFSHKQFLILTNERTLFTVIFPAKSLNDIGVVFPQAVDEVLQIYAIPKQSRKILFEQLSAVQFSRNTKRQVLGSMNDFIKNSKFILEDTPNLSLTDLSLRLCEMPCSPIQMRSPREATTEFLTRVAG